MERGRGGGKEPGEEVARMSVSKWRAARRDLQIRNSLRPEAGTHWCPLGKPTDSAASTGGQKQPLTWGPAT